MQEQIDKNIEREIQESSTIDFENALVEIVGKEFKENKENKRKSKKSTKSNKSQS